MKSLKPELGPRLARMPMTNTANIRIILYRADTVLKAKQKRGAKKSIRQTTVCTTTEVNLISPSWSSKAGRLLASDRIVWATLFDGASVEANSIHQSAKRTVASNLGR